MSKVTSTLKPPASEVLWMLQRALNTMEPARIPKWALDLSDELRTTDEVEIKITREKLETDVNKGDHP